jgi:hypothetical protein
MSLRQAAEKALIQLQGDDAYLGHRSKKRTDAIEALRQALAQPVDLAKVGEVGVWGENREWVGLTDDELEDLEFASVDREYGHLDIRVLSKAIEAKLKEKNV